MIDYNSSMIDYSGDEIMFEETPQGCVIHHKLETTNEFDGLPEIDVTIIISSKKDALALRDSLNKMIELCE